MHLEGRRCDPTRHRAFDEFRADIRLFLPFAIKSSFFESSRVPTYSSGLNEVSFDPDDGIRCRIV